MILHCFVYQHLQEDPEQVAADEAAAAERLDLSRYTDYRTIELDATSGRRSRSKFEVALQVP